jgi:hypothetical protein
MKKTLADNAWIKAAAILAGLTLLGTLLAWYFPITDQRPELASSGANITWLPTQPKVANLQWSNIGTKPVRGGTVTIFTFSNGKRQAELGKDGIIGAGNNVLPRYNGQAKIIFHTEQVTDGLLECVIYFGDNNKKYQQAFLYHLEPVHSDAVPSMPRPSIEQRRAAWS